MESRVPPRGGSANGAREGLTTDDRDHGEDRLAARFRAGDGDALAELCRRCEPALRARIERRLPRSLRRRVSVADVLQEAQLAAYESRDAFEPRGEGAFGRWMLGIVDRKALMAVRHHRGSARRDARQELTAGERPATALVPGREATPSQEAIASELAELARASMQSLPDDYREVLRLVRDEHLPFDRVAERMGRSREAVKKLCARALAQFAAELARRRGATRA